MAWNQRLLNAGSRAAQSPGGGPDSPRPGLASCRVIRDRLATLGGLVWLAVPQKQRHMPKHDFELTNDPLGSDE